MLDGLFDPEILAGIVAEFPRPDDPAWLRMRNRREVKLAASRDDLFPPLTRTMLHHLNSATFLDFLTHITGIKNLMADAYFEGGGMHQIEPGGKLAIHADFNRHGRYATDRRLNALLYLNADWKDEYGGNLELWDREMKSCVQRVAPILGRLVVFATTDFTFHGHPEPLTCPEGMTRKSLALYYYTNGRPGEETSERHSTLFQARPGETLADARPSLKDIARDWLPPVVTRQISRIIG